MMTDQDPDPDDMDVDCSVGCSMHVDCGATDISDDHDSGIEAMDDDKCEHSRRRVTLSHRTKGVCVI